MISYGSQTQPKVAVLILEDFVERAGGSRKAFDDRRYLGLHIILDVIRKAYGIEAEYTSVRHINDSDIILISLTSTNDVYNLIYTFERHGVTVNRPKVIIGGAGVVNVRTYSRYGDFFVFGRGEVAIIDIFEHLLNNAPLVNDSVYVRGRDSLDGVGTFRIAQVDNPYPDEVAGMKESMLGCPKKCFYCAYTYHRKPQKEVYVYHDNDFYSAAEMTIREVVSDIKNGSRVITSIDGSSARLRKAMNKEMSDDEYRHVISAIPPVEADSVFLKVFNICGYPTETAPERYEPFTVLLPVASELANSTTILYQMNPFQPSPLTPAQYLAADIFTDYRAWYKRHLPKPDGHWCVQQGRLRVGYSPAINTNLGLLKRMLVERGTENDHTLIKNVIFNKHLTKRRASEQVKMLLTLPNMERFYRQYEVGERMPFDYLRSYSRKKAIDNLARRLMSELGV